MANAKRPGRRHFLGAAGAASMATLAPAAAADNKIEPGSQQRRNAPATKGASTETLLPPFEVRVLSKMGFGPARRVLGNVSSNPDVILATGFEQRVSNFATQDDVSHFLALGSSDNERLTNYVEEQLHPTAQDPDLQQRMAQYPTEFETLGQSLSVTFNSLECNGFSNYSRPTFQTQFATFNRAVYSRWQLFQLIVDHWHNHFNIFAPLDEDTYVSFASWDRDIIRTNAFGNFYQMLIASAQHPAMLHYLDNVRSQKGGINENYARELFELHGLGAENYAGITNPRFVEALPENPYTALNDVDLNNPAMGFLADPTLPIARFYVDDDVLEAAQSLTGWRYDDENTDSPPGCGTGQFTTDENDHESDSSKAVITQGVSAIPSGLSAEEEGRLIVKMVAYHPGTATNVARRLCTRLISDNPPESIVQAAADTFFQNRLQGDQIRRTLRTILLSDEFRDASNWGTKTKRPFEYVVSAMRAGGCNYTFRDGDSDSESFLSTYNSAGQRLFWWRTPDGYPDQRGHWQGSTSMVQAWRTIDWLVDRNAGDSDTVMRVLAITLDNLPGNPTPRQVVEFWCNWIMGWTPQGSWAGTGSFNQAPTKLGQNCLQFMTQQFANPDATVWPEGFPIPRDELSRDDFPEYWHRRLRGLVSLICWSPQFMQR